MHRIYPFNGDGKEMFNDLYAIDPDGKNETRLTQRGEPATSNKHTGVRLLRGLVESRHDDDR